MQVKYITDGKIPLGTNGGYNGVKWYEEDDFDYFAIYLPKVDKVIYPSIKFRGSVIATEPRNSATDFWWYEDFLDFTDKATKRSYKEFGIKLKGPTIKAKRKVEWPSKQTLNELLWTMPTTKIAERYGVSDNAVARWAKHYGLEKPSRGYWMTR